MMNIKKGFVGTVGNTPLIRLNIFSNETGCEILGKAEDPERAYIEEIMPAKIELNMKYIENPGLSKDLSIMWSTFMKIVR